MAIVTTLSRPQRLRRAWDRHANSYDRSMAFAERRLFADTRDWVVRRARGRTLEVAIGTGLNLPHYRTNLDLVGVEWSAAMLTLATRRAATLGQPVRLVQGDAAALPFPAETFDSVVCTFGLCAVPDDSQVLAESVRVLRPGGRLLLADHVASSVAPVRGLQAMADLVTVPWQGEHFRRRPADLLPGLGLVVEESDRFRLGVIERLAAVKGPIPTDNAPTGAAPTDNASA